MELFRFFIGIAIFLLIIILDVYLYVIFYKYIGWYILSIPLINLIFQIVIFYGSDLIELFTSGRIIKGHSKFPWYYDIILGLIFAPFTIINTAFCISTLLDHFRK